jgi:hypothetical protein
LSWSWNRDLGWREGGLWRRAFQIERHLVHEHLSNREEQQKKHRYAE